jgi:hypothetical protein
MHVRYRLTLALSRMPDDSTARSARQARHAFLAIRIAPAVRHAALDVEFVAKLRDALAVLVAPRHFHPELGAEFPIAHWGLLPTFCKVSLF